MNTVESYLTKFQELLRELFQFDCKDLDFGIYRILNDKRKQIEGFISERLPQIVTQAFAQYAAADRATAQRELEEKRQEIVSSLGSTAFDSTGHLAPAFRETPLGRQYLELEQKAKAGRIAEELQASVYNDLCAFFSRYYEDGDIFSRPRRGKVEIPFTGHEDVVLHWANRDQYYIKTGEQFKNYRLKVNDFAVEFALRNVSAEQNSNHGEKRYFVLAEESPLASDDKTRTLKVFLEYRQLTNKEKITYGKTESQKPQDKLNSEAAGAILKQAKDATLKAHLTLPMGEDKPSLLMHHLTRFTRKNTTDFFIHKELRSFLTRELDDFLKAEVVRIDELLAAQNPDVPRRTLLRAQVVRRIAEHIIDFLAQVEDFQKKLFEKRKFVLRTEYCLTLDRLPEGQWEEVLKNKAQLEEWQQLYALDDLLKQAKKKRPDRDFLKRHDKFVVDTRHFPEDFKWRLLAAFDDLDAALDGQLTKSENFQALALLLAKYHERVKCIYIDPPYNTGSDEFIYRDNYQHSCWLEMMEDRLRLGGQTLTRDGMISISIDDIEMPRLTTLLRDLFGGQQQIASLVWDRNRKNDATFFSVGHEYMAVFSRDKEFLKASGIQLRERKPGIEETRRKFEQLRRLHQDDWGAIEEEWNLYAKGLKDYEMKAVLSKYPKVGSRGPFRDDGNINWPGPGGPHYEILHPKTKKPVKIPKSGWRYPTRERFWEEYDKGNIAFGPDEKSVPGVIYYLFENTEQVMGSVFWSYAQTALDEFVHLFGYRAFENPKNWRDIARIASYLTSPTSVVLDFFAGSGTTAHAVLDLNRQSGRRKYLLVEVADYCETVVLPRIKKVCFAEKWKDGKPVGKRGVSHFMKYIVLESYEDALNNLELPRAERGRVGAQDLW